MLCFNDKDFSPTSQKPHPLQKQHSLATPFWKSKISFLWQVPWYFKQKIGHDSFSSSLMTLRKKRLSIKSKQFDEFEGRFMSLAEMLSNTFEKDRKL